MTERSGYSVTQYTSEQRLRAARDYVSAARGELVNVLRWENRTDAEGKVEAVPLAKAKALQGAGDRAAYWLQCAAAHVRKVG